MCLEGGSIIFVLGGGGGRNFKTELNEHSFVCMSRDWIPFF